MLMVERQEKIADQRWGCQNVINTASCGQFLSCEVQVARAEDLDNKKVAILESKLEKIQSKLWGRRLGFT